MTRILLAILLFAGCNPTPRSASETVSPALAVPLARTGQPDNHPGARLAVRGRVTPSPSPTLTRHEATTKPRTAHSLRGVATWFRSPHNVSAAGPDLRSALGPDWRGTRVRVTGPAGSVLVVLGDWMRADRLVDLDDGAFVRVCGPLSKGICWATVTP